MADIDEEIESTESGASETIPIQAGSVKYGGYVVLSNRPCKVIGYSTAKTGKHGHAKASITGIDIFNGKRYEDSYPTSHNMEYPIIKRTEWQAISIDGEGFVTLMDIKGTIRSDLRLPAEIEADEVVTQRITNGLEEGREVMVTVLSSMGNEKIEAAKDS